MEKLKILNNNELFLNCQKLRREGWDKKVDALLEKEKDDLKNELVSHFKEIYKEFFKLYPDFLKIHNFTKRIEYASNSTYEILDKTVEVPGLINKFKLDIVGADHIKFIEQSDSNCRAELDIRLRVFLPECPESEDLDCLDFRWSIEIDCDVFHF